MVQLGRCQKEIPVNIINKILFSILCLVSALVYAQNQDEEENPAKNVCIAGGDIVFGYFNGVLKTEDEAQAALDVIKNKFGTTTENGTLIKYETFYNTTNDLADFVEVFEQRAKENGKVLADKYELFFDSLSGNGKGLWSSLVHSLNSAKDLLGSIS